MLKDLNLSIDNLSPNDLKDIQDDLDTYAITTLTRVLSILGVCISLFAIIGNFLSIIVLTRKTMKKLSTYTYLLGLSLCDEICSIFTVIVLLQYSILPLIRLSDTIMNNYKILLIYVYPIVGLTQALSVWITLAFTIDRYLYVCHPFYGRKHCNRRRAYITLLFLYLLAAVYSIPQFLERTYAIEDIFGRKTVFQTYTRLGRNNIFIYIYHLFIYCTIVTFIPYTTIVVLNGFLIFAIIKQNKKDRMNLVYKMSLNTNVSNCTSLKNSSKPSIGIYNPSKVFFSCFRKKSEPDLSESSQVTEPCLNHRRTSKKNSIMTEKIILERKNHNDVSIMLIGLIVVFLVCQLPSSILRLITVKNLSIYFQPMYYTSLDISNFLIVTNSTLNCIMYVMLGKKFRKQFLRTFFPKCNSQRSLDTSLIQ